jgi:hypothetical protein
LELFTNPLQSNFEPISEPNLFSILNPINILNSLFSDQSMKIDLPMISITVIDMTNLNRNSNITEGLYLKNNKMLLEDFPQISSNYLF